MTNQNTYSAGYRTGSADRASGRPFRFAYRHSRAYQRGYAAGYDAARSTTMPEPDSRTPAPQQPLAPPPAPPPAARRRRPPANRRHDVITAQALARAILRKPNLVIFDTETTGLDRTAEIVELAIIDSAGGVLLESLVRPTLPVPPEASAVHHITDDHLQSAPTMDDLDHQLRQVLTGRYVVAYNLAYDLRVLNQSLAAHNLQPIHTDDFFYPGNPIADSACIMELYATYHGARSPGHQDYTWQSLEAALQQSGLAFPGDPHQALTDARATLALLEHLAGGL